jgi:hypothetical protein
MKREGELPQYAKPRDQAAGSPYGVHGDIKRRGHDHGHSRDAHDHDHGHGHAHHGHGHHAHRPSALHAVGATPRASLIRLSLGARLSIAVLGSAAIWAGVYWAMS